MPTTTTTTTTTAPATANISAFDTLALKVKKHEPEKHVRNLNPETPDLDNVNKMIEKYNSIIGSTRDFRPLSSLFEKIIRLEQYALKDFLYSILVGFGYDVVYADGYLFAKGNIPVMMCAHMDTVHKEPVRDIYMSDKGCVWSPQGIGGDDRCGIYTALMSIRDGIKPYILFTEDEEIGCVGADYFADDIRNSIINLEDININFIIEVDRKGSNDSVYYDCDNPEFEKFIDTYGFKTAYGSCSDISYVAPALGVAAVNFSSGYYNAHTTSEYIVLDELYNVIERVNTIIKDVAEGKTAKYEYIEAIYSYRGYASKRYYGWDGDDGYDDFDYGRYYGKDKTGKTVINSFPDDETDYEEDESLWDNMIKATLLYNSEYLMLADGSMIETDGTDDFYIGKDNKIYKLIDYSSNENEDYDKFNIIVTPIDAVAFTKNNTICRYDETEAEYVFVVNDELDYYKK